MSQTSSHRMLRLLLNVLAVAAVVFGIWYVYDPARGPIQPPQRDLPVPNANTETSPPAPITPSRYLNTASTVDYVGAQKCAECHPTQHESFLQTPHSRALAGIDLEAEPPSDQFQHDLSGRSYRIYRQGGKMRHQESLQLGGDEGSEDEVLSDYVVSYVIGSGHHSRSYLVESHGFLVESPVTWYASEEQWLMSPGYDEPNHRSFRRVVDVACLFCHAGRVEMQDGSSNRPRLHEQSIACESCHGPGSLHVARRERDVPLADSEIDWTIVQPQDMTREEQESICAQCHLAGVTNVEARGRSITEYRPGLRLAEFRIDYGLENPDHAMTVVGHIQQMRMSRCYQESEQLTCTTCHRPHGMPPLEHRVEYFRQKCIECHAVEDCGLQESERRQQNAADNCAACHMPKSSTEIPHIAFTHHRIGLHESEELLPAQTAASTLVPIVDVSPLPEIECDRGLGLAYLRFSMKQHSDLARQAYRRNSLRLLESVYDRGLRGPDLEEALAIIYWERGDAQEAIRCAESAVSYTRKSAFDSANAWVILGNAYLDRGDFARAREVFSKVVRLRRTSQDWALLGRCLHKTGETQDAIKAFQTASEIDPSRIDIHQALAEIAAENGNQVLANEHRIKARRLLRLTRPK